MNRRLILIVIALWLIAYAAHAQAPLSFGNHDAGAARKNLSNVTPATGRAALGLGTMAVATATDYVATSALALRLDTTNASISENLDVAGNVGAATVNGVAPLTAAEKSQALVGSSTVNFLAKQIDATTVDADTFRATAGTYYYMFEKPLDIYTDVAVDIATFALDAYSAAHVDVVLGGVHNGVGSAGIHKSIGVSRNGGALSITELASSTFAASDIRAFVTVVDRGSGLAVLTVATPAPNTFMLSGSVKIRGRAIGVQ